MGITRTSLPALFAAVTLLGSSPAHATAVVWQSAFLPIEEMSGGADRSYPLLSKGNLDGNMGEAREIVVPFDFYFLGTGPYSTLNVGAKGYAIPGGLSVDNSLARGDPSYLFQLLAPRNLVAVWWGDHRCDPEVLTKTLGTAPNRRFVLEWVDCGIAGITTRTTFQAQLWLVEGSDAIQARYGALTKLPGADWLRVGWGTKGISALGVLGPNRDGVLGSCDPTLPRGTSNACDSRHFPAFSTIQYGLQARPDLAGRVQVREAELATSPPRIVADLVLVNGGSTAVEGVGFELFLAAAANPVPLAPANLRILAHPPVEALAAGETRPIPLELQPERVPSGSYKLCAKLDPGGLIAGNDPGNDWACSHEIAHLGPELTGSIEAPPSSAPGELVAIPLTILNQGNQDAGPFQYRIRAVAADGTPRQIFQERLDGLYVGETRNKTVEFNLPPNLRGGTYFIELDLDPSLELVDVDRSNNIIQSPGTIQLRTASLSFSAAPTLELPNGCYFGEPVRATLAICNTGDAEALGFYPGLVAADSPGSGVGFDPIAGSSLPYCGVPGSWGYQACPLVQGKETVCAAEFCRLACAQDADCGTGMRCLDDPELASTLGIETARSCVHRLASGAVAPGERCRSFQVDGRIPFVDLDGVPFSRGPMFFKMVDDLRDVLGQATPSIREIGPFECYEALPDLEAVELAPLDPAMGGKAIRIWRRIENKEFTSFLDDGFTRREKEPFQYGYFLSRTPDVSVRQIPLRIEETPNGFDADALGRDESSARIDRVRIPADLAPGAYYLGLIVDPEGRVRENDKRNNLRVFLDPIVVEASSLSIVSDELPRAVEGRSFTHALVATPAAAAPLWSSDPLPPGLRLRGDGLLEGIPSQAGTYSFRIRVRAGALEATKILALQVIAPTSGLAIETSQLTPAVRGLPYGTWFDAEAGEAIEVVRLAASGGVPPYRWDLDPDVEDNLLPAGINGPTEDGLLSGIATPLSISRTVVVRVTDSLGTLARRELSLVVLDEGALSVSSRPLPLATSSEAYSGCITANGGLGAVQWIVAPGTLPKGLSAEPSDRSLCLQGIPLECGAFNVGVHVQDEAAGVASAQVSLEIRCGSIQLNARDLQLMSPGEVIDVQLRAIPSRSPRFRLHQGTLPAGLALEADGTLHGTVAMDVRLGAHDVIVEIADEEGRRGLNPLTLRVEGEIPPREVVQLPRQGCSSGTGSAAGIGGSGLAVALALLARRRRDDARVAGRRALFAGSTALLAWAMVLGCGDELVGTEVSRCAEASCAANLSCDEADGLCKCGGVTGRVCSEEEICVLEPAAQCISPRCEFVHCDRGMICDAASGDCFCGTEPCAAGEHCSEGVCTEASACDGVRCEEGLACDPSDGFCKCGETLCEGDAICIDGDCVSGRCVGVSCGMGSVCNPDDGSCHCGGAEGPVCSAGEACVADGVVASSCQLSPLCAGVSCPAGETCDPDDGVCRCGGVGFNYPGCSVGASCVEGRCVGGDLCAPDGVAKLCAAGLSCDPADGICKCGETDRVLCAEDEGCTTLEGAPTCMKRCAPLDLSPGCGQDEACYPDAEHAYRFAFCAPVGSQRLDQSCSSPTACGSRLFCTRSEVCAALCDASEPLDSCSAVKPGLDCVALLPGAEVGYCRAP